MPSELTFRAQLVLNEQRQIYDYWCRQAGWNRMPGCDDLNIGNIASVAQSLSLLKVNEVPGESEFYSSGTRASDVYGFNLKGKTLQDFEWGEKQQYWDTVYSRVISECRPRQGAMRSQLSDKPDFILFWLRLPLSNNGETVTDVLCHDVPYPIIKRESAYMPGFTEDYAVAY
ncbi:MAG: PAS domain-containing protein [Methyloligellaceae bacterium]